MTVTNELSVLLNWKLLKGGHKFPGPDGGTCINEAAMVVAGFEYREISHVSDCPPCFSRPIAAYALGLNDRMPDNLRQELLMPFVTRLAGTADGDAVERQRADLIVIQSVNKILPVVLRLHKLDSYAVLCERAKTRIEAYTAANKARHAMKDASVSVSVSVSVSAYAAYAAAYAAASAYAAYAAAYAAASAYADDAAAYAAYAAAYAAASAAADAADAYAYADAFAAAADAASAYAYAFAAAADAADARREIWTKATTTLDSALSIGQQAEPIEKALILDRVEKAKRGECASL